MSKHTINGFVTYQKYPWSDEPRIDFSSMDPATYTSSSEWPTVAVCKHSFEVDVPDDFDPRPQQVAALEAEKRKVRAEFAKRITDLDEQISKLLCLEAA